MFSIRVKERVRIRVRFPSSVQWRGTGCNRIQHMYVKINGMSVHDYWT